MQIHIFPKPRLTPSCRVYTVSQYQRTYCMNGSRVRLRFEMLRVLKRFSNIEVPPDLRSLHQSYKKNFPFQLCIRILRYKTYFRVRDFREKSPEVICYIMKNPSLSQNLRTHQHTNVLSTYIANVSFHLRATKLYSHTHTFDDKHRREERCFVPRIV